MIATSPIRNDIGNLAPGSQIEMQQSVSAYHNSMQQQQQQQWNSHHHAMNGMNASGDGMGMGYAPNQMGGMPHHGHYQYDQMMGFSGSDEEDCFDHMSDQGGDDSNSSDAIDETRIQQL
jgi:hypothetical protein